MTEMTAERVGCVARACDGTMGLNCHNCHGLSAPRPARSRARLLSGGKPGYRAGRLHVQIKRAFTATGAQQLPTGVLMRFCYPRLKRYPRGHYRHLWRAAVKVCDCLGRQPRAQGRPNVWRLKRPPAAP